MFCVQLSVVIMIIVTQNPKIEYNKMKSLCEKGVFDKYRLI